MPVTPGQNFGRSVLNAAKALGLSVRLSPALTGDRIQRCVIDYRSTRRGELLPQYYIRLFVYATTSADPRRAVLFVVPGGGEGVHTHLPGTVL